MTNTTPPRLIDADGNGINLGARIVDSNGYHDRLIKVITDASGAPNGYLRTSRGVRPVADFEDYVILTAQEESTILAEDNDLDLDQGAYQRPDEV